jgi:hypothetical protein
VGEAHGTHGRGEKSVQGFGGKTTQKTEAQMAGWTLGQTGGGEKIHLAQDRGQWCALVNAMMNLQVLAPWS